MLLLSQLVDYCEDLLNVKGMADFTGAYNGLQVANSGKISKLGAAVDASLLSFELAKEKGVDFLVVHHGLFWEPWTHITGPHYQRIKTLLEADCALYSAHLPLDAHITLGNNVQMAAALDLSILDSFLNFKGTDIGVLTDAPASRDILKLKLETLFNRQITALEFGSRTPSRIALCAGSGSGALQSVIDCGVDTFITGELKQSNFSQIQEAKLNVYACGHYATEVFGVRALAQQLAEHFDLEWTFLDTQCPL